MPLCLTDIEQIGTKYDSTKFTPLQIAIDYGHKEIVLLLINKGANINIINDKSNTPLHEVALVGDDLLAECLINNGADINAKNLSGTTPLHFAVSKGNKK